MSDKKDQEQQQQQQKEQEEQTANASQTKIILYFLNKKFLPIDITGSDNLGEIKMFLTEQTILNLYTNFYFQYNGETLSESVEFSSFNIPENAEIHIKLNPIDEKSAKQHLRKVNNILNNPAIFSAYVGNQQQQALIHEQQEKEDIEEEELEKEDQKNTQQQQEKEKGNNKKNKKQNNNNKNEDLLQVDDEDDEDLSDDQDSDSEEEGQKPQQVININEALAPSLANKFLTISNNPDSNPVPVTSFSKLVSYINYSGFNPPPSYRKLKGDQFYIVLRTLENTVYHVTVCPRGFYLNKSNMKYFDPTPVANAKYYINLLDLLSALSPQFKENFQKLLNTKNDNNHLFVSQTDQPIPPIYQYGINWLSKNIQEIKPETTHEWNQSRAEDQLQYSYGFDPQGIRDWNEELQVCRDLPKTDFVTRLNRDKALIKTYTDFVEAAVQGAKAVVEGNLSPINPTDPQNQHVYLYNNIFFSFALENSDNFRQESGIELSPTVSTSNCDLRNLKYLHKLDVPDLHVLNTVLVDYRGERVIAQSIIPGILASEQHSCSEYGSIDDGKTIHSNQEFHLLMKEICKHFYLDDEIKFQDEQGKEHILGASMEVKGIRGTDRRKYMLDLMRLSVRDMNYPDPKEHSTCVLRQELVTNYIIQKNYDLFQQQEEQEEKDMNDTEKSNRLVTKNVRFQEWLHKNESKFSLKLNPSLNTKQSIVETDKISEQKEDLQKLAEYLKNKAIPNLINDFTNNTDNGRLSDSKSIQEAFHSHGINMRYLGEVCSRIDGQQLPQVKIVLERVMLVKSIKHVFRKIMRECNSIYITNGLSHMLNCVFAPQYLQKLMNEGLLVHDIESQQNSNVQEVQTQSKKAKKKNKKKQKQQQQEQQQDELLDFNNENIDVTDLIKIETPDILKIKPVEVWERIKHIAKSRYNYDIISEEQTHYKFTNFNRLATIRDLCLTLGIQIESLDYQFKEQDQKWVDEQKDLVTQQFKQLHNNQQQPQSVQQQYVKSQLYNQLAPFKSSNIIDIQPIIKAIEYNSQDAKLNLDMAQRLHGEGKINELLECCNSALQILQNLYGPVHKDIAGCYQRMASVQYSFLRDINSAITYCRQAIKIYKKCLGEVNFQTALAYQTLGYYYFCKKSYNKCYKYMLKSLFLISLIGGESHPDSQMLFTNLAMFFGDNDQQQASLSCLFEYLDRTILVYGKEHIKLAQCYQNIALAHAEQINDIKKAIEFQEKAISVLQKHISNPEDINLREAQLYLQNFKLVQNERKKNHQLKLNEGAGGRQFGQNSKQGKQQKQQQQNQQQQGKQQQVNGGKNGKQDKELDASDLDRQILLHKFRQAKLQKQYLRNSNLNKFLHVYQNNQQSQQQQSQPQTKQDQQ